MQLVGTAIVFDSPSQDLGGFTEVVKYQAVQKSLQRNNDVYLLWQHDAAQPLARVKTGSLRLSLTNAGLDFVATLPNSPLGQNAFQAISDGTVDSVSFGFSIEPDGGDKWLTNEQGGVVRELWDINITELSPVTWAAYLAPHVDTRSCPNSLRSQLTCTRDSDEDEDDSCNPDSPDYDPDADCDDEDRCDCTCDFCSQDDDCSSCSDDQCEATNCLSCPAQTRAAHLQLLIRRLK
jgi:HK97 family phage prohead protease